MYTVSSTSSADTVVLILSVALTAVFWVWMWWHVISKIGYRDLPRKLWIVGMCLPPFFGFVMILLLVLPWPVHRQLRQVRKRASELEALSGVDEQLKQLRNTL
jgi:hypothetical protein